MVRKALLAFLLSTQLISFGFAQQPQAPNLSTPPPPQQPQKPDEDDVVRITTNLVQVDSVITDNHGKPVTDLKPDEVEIFEDGRKQKIANFSFTLSEAAPQTVAKSPRTAKEAPPIPSAALRREDIKRTIAIIVDENLNCSFDIFAAQS